MFSTFQISMPGYVIPRNWSKWSKGKFRESNQADRIFTWNRCTIGWTSRKRHWSWSKLQHLGLQKFIKRTLILKNFLWVQSWRFYNLAMIVLLNWKPYYPPAFKPLSIIDLQNMITKNYLQVFRGTIIFNLFCV